MSDKAENMTDAVAAVLAQVHNQPPNRKYSVAEVKELVYPLITLIDGPEVVRVEYEWGYQSYSVFGDDLGIWSTGRTPDNWLTTMGIPFKRIGTGEWKLHRGKVTYQLDPRPWLKQGEDPNSYPLENRSKERREGYVFSPRTGYQNDFRAYTDD